MTEHKARRLAYGGAALIVSLMLLCFLLSLIYPEAGVYRKVCLCLLGLLFLYGRAIPRRLWVPS